MFDILLGIAIGAAFSKFWLALWDKAMAALKAPAAKSEDK